MAEAFGEACHDIGWQSECAGCNVSEHPVSLEKVVAQADLAAIPGKTDTTGMHKRSSTPSRCAGIVVTACTQGKAATREALWRGEE